MKSDVDKLANQNVYSHINCSELASKQLHLGLNRDTHNAYRNLYI